MALRPMHASDAEVGSGDDGLDRPDVAPNRAASAAGRHPSSNAPESGASHESVEPKEKML